MNYQQTPIPGNFILLSYLFRSELLKVLEADGIELTVMHFEVLKMAECLQRCTAGAISQNLKRDNSQIARLVQSLIEDGYLRKLPDPSDARVSILQLTRRGRTIYSRMEREEQTLIRRLQAGLTKSELSEFSRVVAQMRANLAAE